MTMRIDRLIVGPIDTNCYIVSSGVGDATETLVIDPGEAVERIVATLDGRIPKLVVLTHRHWDHLGALEQLADRYDLPIACHEADAHAACHPDENGAATYGLANAAPRIDRYIKDEDVIEVGDLRFTVLHTPGHTVGSICLYEPSEAVLFSGDTLFKGTVGRTDLATGSLSDMRGSCDRLGQLPGDVVVYPGHGDTTTIGQERSVNPLLRQR